LDFTAFPPATAIMTSRARRTCRVGDIRQPGTWQIIKYYGRCG
jgi:hypothetical protein